MPANTAKWDQRYLRGEHTIKEPSPLLRTAIKSLKPGRALDVACGVGRHAIFLAENGWHVTAVDSSRVGVEILQERAREAGVTVEARVGDLESGEFHIEPASYELICVFYYLQRDLFAPIRAGVKTGGTVVAAIHLNDGKENAKPANPAFLFEGGELKQLFVDWEITYYREGGSDAGGHHHDTAYLIARKPTG
ncbi:MAG TPA: methyltransferase domain-containing protein [Pyrinomonadaceae bacterium]|nr:methyltransferase domain-containing protein [Pyrinomonadaceae bacterium]